MAGSLKRISKQMAVGLMNVEYNIEQIANATGLVNQTNRVESHIAHLVVSFELAVETFVEISDRADSNLVSRNVMTRQDLLQMNVKSNDIYHSLRPLFQTVMLKITSQSQLPQLPIGPRMTNLLHRILY